MRELINLGAMAKDSYKDFCERNGISEGVAAAALQNWQRSQGNAQFPGDHFLKYCKDNSYWNGEYGTNETQIACYIKAWATVSSSAA